MTRRDAQNIEAMFMKQVDMEKALETSEYNPFSDFVFRESLSTPRCSMVLEYYIWAIFVANVGSYGGYAIFS